MISYFSTHLRTFSADQTMNITLSHNLYRTEDSTARLCKKHRSRSRILESTHRHNDMILASLKNKFHIRAKRRKSGKNRISQRNSDLNAWIVITIHSYRCYQVYETPNINLIEISLISLISQPIYRKRHSQRGKNKAALYACMYIQSNVSRNPLSRVMAHDYISSTPTFCLNFCCMYERMGYGIMTRRPCLVGGEFLSGS